MEILNIKISKLIVNYLKGTLSPEDTQELNQWLENKHNKELFDQITDKNNILDKKVKYQHYDIEKAWVELGIENKISINSHRKWFRIVAAILFPLVFLSIFYYTNIKTNKDIQIAERTILPGESNAMIYFSDGKVIDLDKDTSEFIERNNLRIEKLNGKIVINSVAMTESPDKLKLEPEIKFEKIVTGKGNEQEIVLPDGTLVKMNADSYLEFPSIFANKERNVKTKGELFFKVKKDVKRPFTVESGQMKLKVLGTEFNIRYYPEEKDIVSTLVEGSVEVTNFMQDKVILKPGQAAILHRQTDEIKMEEVDVETAIAWKEGRFYFRNQTMEVIMNELSRWYDFEFEFESDKLRYERFTVDVPRFENCNKILSKIEGTQILSIDINADKIVIRNK